MSVLAAHIIPDGALLRFHQRQIAINHHFAVLIPHAVDFLQIRLHRKTDIVRPLLLPVFHRLPVHRIQIVINNNFLAAFLHLCKLPCGTHQKAVNLTRNQPVNHRLFCFRIPFSCHSRQCGIKRHACLAAFCQNLVQIFLQIRRRFIIHPANASRLQNGIQLPHVRHNRCQLFPQLHRLLLRFRIHRIILRLPLGFFQNRRLQCLARRTPHTVHLADIHINISVDIRLQIRQNKGRCAHLADVFPQLHREHRRAACRLYDTAADKNAVAAVIPKL